MMPTPNLPLSPVQLDALVETALDGTAAARIRVSRFALPAGLRAGAVVAAWESVMAAHPLLSVRIDWSGAGEPAQEPAVVADCEIVPEYGGEPPQGTTVRAFCVGSDEAKELVLVYHRLVLDDRGAALLAAHVADVAVGKPVDTLPGVADYLAGRPADGSAEAFWRDLLAPCDGAVPLLPDSTQEQPRYGELVLPLEPELIERAGRLAAELGVPLRWLHLAAWTMVVSVFRGSPLTAVGARVDCRPPGLERAVGSFELTLPAITRVDRTPARRWLGELVRTLRGIHEHCHVTGADLNNWSSAERGVALFDTEVDLRPEPDAGIDVRGTPAIPLATTLWTGSGPRLTARFDQTRIDAASTGKLLRHTALALSALTGAGDEPIRSVPVMDEGERTWLLRELNDTAAPYPDRCLHQLFEEQAARAPDATAVVFDGESLTYGELNRRANRLAHHVGSLGVGPDAIVGLCAEPGFAMVTAILAILKAGGAYAPLDPAFPPERLEYLVSDLRPRVSVVQRRLRDRLPAEMGPVIYLDDPAAWSDQPDTDPVRGVGPRNLAYVMYTSGSTGRPKGVMVEHRGSVNYVWWMTRLRDLPPGSAALQWTTYSFDAAVWELFWPLFTGARAALAPARFHLELDAFVALIQREQVATLHFVPAMLQVFLSARDVAGCTSLRHVFCSGEPIPQSLVERFHSLLDAELINLYGVTEVSIDSTHHSCPPGAAAPFVPAGRPLANTTVYVLDEDLLPIPQGALGEVYIGGDSVTRGYLGRPGLTVDRFLPDPYRGGGNRMYRTGDVAKVLSDGSLHFLGRSDHQVKIRGIRIELPEVEAELAAHEAVTDCLVVARGEGGDRFLAAYAVTSAPVQERELREFMAARMPDYMVPAAIVLLDAWPLNQNGKIDRAALPPPEVRRQTGTAPRTGTERELAAIWAELLGVDTVGIHDDFFSLGGNSLLATHVIARVRDRFGAHLPLRVWLGSSSVAELAAAVDRHTSDRARAEELLAELTSSDAAPDPVDDAAR